MVNLLFGTFFVCYLYTLYRHLRGSRGPFEVAPGQRRMFIAIAILGALAIPAIVGIAVWFSLGDGRSKAGDARVQAAMAQFRAAQESSFDSTISMYTNAVP